MPENDVLIFLDGTIKMTPRVDMPDNTRQMLFPPEDGDTILFQLAFDPESTNKVRVWVMQ